MKVTKQQPTPNFKPVELTLVFESQEELDAFKRLAGLNVTVSDYLKEYQGMSVSHAKTLNDQLSQIFWAFD